MTTSDSSTVSPLICSPDNDVDTPPVEPVVIDLPTVHAVIQRHWRQIIKNVGVDATAHRHQWQLVRTTRTIDDTVTTAHGAPFDSLYEAKRMLRINRRTLTREQPEAKARGDRWKLPVVHGAGAQALDPISGATT